MKRVWQVIALTCVWAAGTTVLAVEDGLGTNHVRTLKVYNGIVLGGNAITSWQDVSGSTLTNNSITTDMIQNGAVTVDKVAGAVAGDGLTGGAGSALAVGAGSGISVAADAVSVDSSVLRTTGDQTVSGVKTFDGTVIVPVPTANTHAATKLYVDDKLSSSVAAGSANNDTLRWTGTAWTNTAGLTVDGTGNTAVGGTLGVTGAVTLNNVTESTDKDTGALVVQGGAGVEKNLNVGGNAAVVGTLGVTGASTLGAVTMTGNITFTGSSVSALAMGDNKITGLAAPTAGTDAAHKTYVDNAINGLTWKAAVKAATTANVARDSDWRAQTIDGVALAAGDRVMLKNQSTGAQNGLYEVSSANGYLVRTADMSASAQLSGAAVFVSHGTTQAGTAWVCSTPDVVLNTGAVGFVQFASPGTYTAGDGLELNGLEFKAKVSDVAGAGLESDGSNNLRVSAAAAGDGLTGGAGSALAVGAGSGISVAADAVSVDSSVLRTTGDQTVSGVKTFDGTVIVPVPTANTHAATKLYVDDKLSSSVAAGSANNDTLRWTGTAWTNTAGLTVDGTGNTTVGGTLGVTGAVTLNNVTESTDKDTGALVVQGGVGVEKNLNVGGTVGVIGAVTLANTTASTDKDTGALVVEGGVGVEGAINVGGALSVAGNATLGNAIGTDTVTVSAKTTFAGAVVVSPSGVLQIEAGTGITATHLQNAYLKVRGDSGAVDLTVNPQIAGGTAGQMLTLQGTDSTNTLKLDDGNGLVLAGGVAFTIKSGHLIQFIFDGSVWRETFRTVPAP